MKQMTINDYKIHFKNLFSSRLEEFIIKYKDSIDNKLPKYFIVRMIETAINIHFDDWLIYYDDFFNEDDICDVVDDSDDELEEIYNECANEFVSSTQNNLVDIIKNTLKWKEI